MMHELGAHALGPDTRAFQDATESYSSCRRCGCGLVLLPDDRRQGYCFDCYDIYDIDSPRFISFHSLRISCASE